MPKYCCTVEYGGYVLLEVEANSPEKAAKIATEEFAEAAREYVLSRKDVIDVETTHEIRGDTMRKIGEKDE